MDMLCLITFNASSIQVGSRTQPNMVSSSETTGSHPLTEDQSSPPFNLDQEPKVREWSLYELDTVCSLLCKYEHIANSKEKKKKRNSYAGERNGKQLEDHAGDSVLLFATKLNEALHGTHDYKHDIPLADVKELMDFIETKNEAAIKYIQRQATPFRVTRAKKFAFQRLYHTFNRTFFKWTFMHRERRRNPALGAEEEKTRSDWIDSYLSNQERGEMRLASIFYMPSLI